MCIHARMTRCILFSLWFLSYGLFVRGSTSPCGEILAILAGERLPSGHRSIARGPFRGVEVTGNIQTTTRGRELRLGTESFRPEQIDFSSALQHVQIHTTGEIAGSQFHGFSGPEQVADLLRAALPRDIRYDQFGRAEITLQFNRNIGFTGVISKAELEAKHPGAKIRVGQRIPGGVPAEVDGIKGAWFPEMERDSSGKMVVKLGPDGKPANPHFKFESDALIVDGVSAEATNKITVVIQKTKDGKHQVVTMFPGDNAPAFPARIDNYKVNTLTGGTPERAFWDSHVFLRPGTKGEPAS